MFDLYNRFGCQNLTREALSDTFQYNNVNVCLPVLVLGGLVCLLL